MIVTQVKALSLGQGTPLRRDSGLASGRVARGVGAAEAIGDHAAGLHPGAAAQLLEVAVGEAAGAGKGVATDFGEVGAGQRQLARGKEAGRTGPDHGYEVLAAVIDVQCGSQAFTTRRGSRARIL